MVKELKIEKAENGYIVNLMDFSGKKRIFKTFPRLVKFMRSYFDENREHITITTAVEQ